MIASIFDMCIDMGEMIHVVEKQDWPNAIIVPSRASQIAKNVDASHGGPYNMDPE